MSLTIEDGGLVELAPNEERVINMSYDEALGAGVTLTSAPWTITAIRPTTATGLSKDNESILALSPYNSRFAQVRLIAVALESALGQEFRVENTATTSESPVQRKPRSFIVKIQR